MIGHICGCATCNRNRRAQAWFDVVLVVIVGAGLALAKWKGWI